MSAGHDINDLINLIGSLPNAYEATRVGLVPLESIEDIKVGDVAWVHSHGAFRRGRVTKVGRTSVHVALTTRGAVDFARRYGSSVNVTGPLSTSSDVRDLLRSGGADVKLVQPLQ